MSAAKTISFVIPVYRNERAVTLTYQKIKGALASDLSSYDYEFVFVDDGSDDGSLAELLRLRDADPRVRVISFTRNFGQMAAILAGLKGATGDVILHLSADLQVPVELIPRMVRDYEAGSELVIGHRAEREDKWTSRITSRVFYRIIRISFPQMPAGGFDYVLMARRVVDSFNNIEVRNRFFQGDLLWMGYKTTFIPYTRAKRTIGRSQYTFAKRLKNSLDAILDSSYLPIRFISVAGAATAFLGFLYALNIAYTYFRHGTPFTGWAPIMILLLLIGGVLMLMLGIIGEYVWRIYDEVKRKPNYVIRETYGPLTDASYQEIDGFRCYAPTVAVDHSDYPSGGFDVTAEVEARSFWCRTRNRVLTRVFQRFTDRSRPLDVLEIGCGIGGVLDALRAIPNLRLTGSEIYIHGLRYARAKMPGIEFIQLDATDIPFREAYDVVGAFDVIEHIDRDELVMQQVHDALRPGGLFVVTVPQYPWMWSKLDELVHHKRRYRRRELLERLKRAGFEVTYVTSFVTVLFPLMFLTRVTDWFRLRSTDSMADFSSRVAPPAAINTICDWLMRLDEWALRVGLTLPFGGSLLAVARKGNREL